MPKKEWERVFFTKDDLWKENLKGTLIVVLTLIGCVLAFIVLPSLLK